MSQYNAYDVVVIGLGIMGASTLWQLRHSGVRCLGIDPGGPTHCAGSSHGATRIFRRAYWEGEAYLPLLHAAHAGWSELQSSSDKRLIVPTGGVLIGQKSTTMVSGCVQTAVAGNIAHEYWDATALKRHLPQFTVADDVHAVYEPHAYALAAEDARLHMLNQAVQAGAEIRYGSAVTSIDSTASGVTLTTRSGEVVHAGAVVVTAGPWIAQTLLPELAPLIAPKRVPIYWFDPKPGQAAQFDRERLPVFIHEYDDGAILYGIPAGASAEQGVKIGLHNRQQRDDNIDNPAPPLGDDLKREIAERVAAILPGLDPWPRHGKWCIYTMSADESFLLGASERSANVYYASACSGHGFKFATAIGAVMAALAQHTSPAIDIGHFHPGRFGRTEA